MMKKENLSILAIIVISVSVISLVALVQAVWGDGGAGITKAIAVLHPTQGNNVSGIVTFSQMSAGVKIEAEIAGLSPGKHGFHIHEFGDCSAVDGTSAGGHYNPTVQPHAGPAQKERHMGDLGNIEADDSGKAVYDRVDFQVVVNGPDSIIGRGIIVHAGMDDLKSQPSGAAGPRVACGVIGVARE
jgi:superoxide dismutase, Cu-Zn family